MKDKCGCVSCKDRKTSNKTKTCEKCQGNMTNTRVVCYNGNSNNIPQSWVTDRGDHWTANHGWSRCENCGNLGPYITC